MGHPPTLVHTFPPDQPVILEHRQQTPFNFLTRAWVYLCGQFPPFGTRGAMRSNIDARLLLTRAQDAVVRDSEIQLPDFGPAQKAPPPYDGNLVQSLIGTVTAIQSTGLRIKEAEEDSGLSPALVPALRQEPAREFTVKPLGYLIGCTYDGCQMETALSVSTEKFSEEPSCAAHVIVRLSEWMAGE